MSTVKTVVVMVEKWKGHSRQPQVGDLTSGLTSVSRKMPLWPGMPHKTNLAVFFKMSDGGGGC